MFRISDLIDLPVLDTQSGKQVCTIKTLVFEKNKDRLKYLVCKESLLKKYTKVIPFWSVQRISRNGLYISHKNAITELKNINKLKHSFVYYDSIMNTLIMNSDQEILGIITDIYISEQNGKITAYEVSDGYLDDILRGRKILEHRDINGLHYSSMES